MITALEFLTRIEFSSAREWSPEGFSRSVLWFPLIGLLAGAVLAGVNYLLVQLATPVFLRSILLLLGEFLILGVLMYDGFMDTCDGVFSARDRARMLEIMKDSHVGANGVLGAVLLLLTKFALYASLPAEILTLALVMAFLFTRSMMVFFIICYPYARNSGIGKMFKDYARSWYWLPGLVLTCLMVFYFGMVYLLAVGVGFVLLNGVAQFLKNQLGGLTGDTYGFLTEVGEAVFMLAVFGVGKVL
ncbi:MAG: adenosylcobinamide-GDP ribazoletransferase [Acidaminococcaceae bacterium]|nr:adenosylcobinamide-GDP ribazoletransferase [Acidaminococcaceae bacterium]